MQQVLSSLPCGLFKQSVLTKICFSKTEATLCDSALTWWFCFYSLPNEELLAALTRMMCLVPRLFVFSLLTEGLWKCTQRSSMFNIHEYFSLVYARPIEHIIHLIFNKFSGSS